MASTRPICCMEYRARGEYARDLWEFLDALHVGGLRVVSHSSGNGDDDTLTFTVECAGASPDVVRRQLAHMKRLSRASPDLHVVRETLAPVVEYTGERTYDDGDEAV